MDSKGVMMNEPKERPEICERCFAFAVRIVKLAQTLERKGQVRSVLGRQLLKSGTSIGANVEEAQAAQTKSDFIAKMTIAQKEARETLYWLRLLAEADVLPGDRLADLIDESDQLCRILARIVISAKNRRRAER